MSRIAEDGAQAEYGDRIADALSAKFGPISAICPFCKSKNLKVTPGSLFTNLPEEYAVCLDCGADWVDTDLGDD